MNTKSEKSEKKHLFFQRKKFGSYKWIIKNGFTIKRPRKRSSHGFGPWTSNTRLEKLWGTLTDKLFREPLVLLCFRAKRLKNHWFYCVFAQKYWKSIGFTVFSLKKVEKPLVLLKNCCKHAKKWEKKEKKKKPLVLLWKIVKKEQKPL